MPRLKQPTDATEMLAYLMAKTDRTQACWIWLGSATKGKFPQMRYEGSAVPVRRLAYQFLVGEIKPDHQIAARRRCHCLCVRPEHLVSRSKATAGKGHPVSLQTRVKIAAVKRVKAAKLTVAQVAEIRASGESGVQLAARYGVSRGLPSRIRRGDAWRLATGPFTGLLAA